MKKAFFFDMDGVLGDTETEWDRLGYDDLLKSHFGAELFSQVQISNGTSIKSIFDKFVAVGWKGSYQDFHEANEKIAQQIYHVIPLTPGIDDLIDYLAKSNFIIGIVSSSPVEWINTLVSRIANHDKIGLIVSVNNHKDLRPKPSADPYVYAMKEAGVIPDQTIILEDSLPGVTAAKASGARTICFTGHHHGESWQIMPNNADFYAASMDEVQEIVAKIGLT